MAHIAAKTKRSIKRTAAQAADPRFATLARLLARHAAKRDFKKELSQEELIESQNKAYPADSLPEDAS